MRNNNCKASYCKPHDFNNTLLVLVPLHVVRNYKNVGKMQPT